MNNYAPVLICTLNRHVHFKRCVESLAACTDADKTDLFIGFDFPLNENHWEGYLRIKEYLKEISGFKTVNVITRKVNFGPEKNFLDIKSQIFDKYDRMIISEDDNVFAPTFLSFVNKGLDVYLDREDIFSVTGYQYPIHMPESYDKDIYIWQGFSAWGTGIWRDKWNKVEWEKSKALIKIHDLLKNYKQLYKFGKIANNYIPALIGMVEKYNLNGDSYICFYEFLKNKYSVFPVVTRVRNTGHDGSGINGGFIASNIYRDQYIYEGTGIIEMPYNIKPNSIINSVLYKHFKSSIKTKLQTVVKIIKLNLFSS